MLHKLNRHWGVQQSMDRYQQNLFTCMHVRQITGGVTHRAFLCSLLSALECPLDQQALARLVLALTQTFAQHRREPGRYRRLSPQRALRFFAETIPVGLGAPQPLSSLPAEKAVAARLRSVGRVQNLIDCCAGRKKLKSVKCVDICLGKLTSKASRLSSKSFSVFWSHASLTRSL